MIINGLEIKPGLVYLKALEVINDITQSLLYDVEHTFKEEHPEYKTEDDECFIPRSSFKENVTEALLEANQKFWNSANECPPCDTLHVKNVIKQE